MKNWDDVSRQEDSIRWCQTHATALAAQDRQFVAEHEDLQIFAVAGTEAQDDQLQHALKKNVTD